MSDTIPRERIGIVAEAIGAGRALVALPSQNPSMGPTLEVVGLEGEGYLLTVTDPMGAHVWSVLLTGSEMP